MSEREKCAHGKEYCDSCLWSNGKPIEERMLPPSHQPVRGKECGQCGRETHVGDMHSCSVTKGEKCKDCQGFGTIVVDTEHGPKSGRQLCYTCYPDGLPAPVEDAPKQWEMHYDKRLSAINDPTQIKSFIRTLLAKTGQERYAAGLRAAREVVEKAYEQNGCDLCATANNALDGIDSLIEREKETKG